MMKCLIFMLFLTFQSLSLFGNTTFSPKRLEAFYEEYLQEQKEDLYEAGLISHPLKESPVSRLSVVFTNTTGLPANEVYVTLAGQQVAGGTQYFFQLNTQTGAYTPIEASHSTYSPTYSYPLSSFPSAPTGANDYIASVPALNGARFYFSIRQPIYLQSDTPNAIQPPTYYAFYDPNYNNLYETVELTFLPTGGGASPAIPWTASVNTTEVDAFCFPIRIGYFSLNSQNPSAVIPLVQDPNALPSGFGVGGLAGATTRSGILTSVVNGLTTGDLSGSGVWPRLAIPFYSNPYTATGLQTHLRILSPKQSLGNAAAPANPGGLTNQHIGNVDGSKAITFQNYNFPPFPTDYFTAGYGAPTNFSDSLFSFYTGGTLLYMSTGGGFPTVYQGVTTGTAGNFLLTLTGISGPNTGQVSTLAQGNLNAFHMYSGSQPFSGGGDGNNLGFFFGDAFTVGVLPSSIGTLMADPIDITDATVGGWEATNISNYYLPANSAVTGGPWYSLYAKELHKVAVRNTSTTFLNNYGLCYAYDFDDSLGISGTITPSILTPASLNPYLRITLGAIDTPIPDPYSDPTTYTSVTFNFPAGRTLSYQKGNGPILPATSGTPIPNVQSNSTTPLRIFYTNPHGSSEFIVYLYYQFLIPQKKYTSTEISVINSTSINPNSPTPTTFTIDLLP